MPFSYFDNFSVTPTLFPAETIPYLIIAPQYTGMSAGVRVMHMLCHSLNLIGQRAYIITYPQLVFDKNQDAFTCPELCTPLMTQDILGYFEKRGRSPIVVYLEAIRSNPLNATNVVRYALNYPGLLGGDKTFPSHEMLYAYSSRIAIEMGLGEDRVMFMPCSDTNIFRPAPESTMRKGGCFYAAKYRDFHKGTLQPITENCFEITRYQPDSLTKSQIAELFHRSEVFYTYEDTALAIEAGLCGCPTVFIPNPFLDKPLGFDDLGMDGFAWGTAPEELERAKATVHRFPANYEALITRYWRQLEKFAAHTQAAAQKNISPAPLVPLKLPALTRFHTVTYITDYIQQYGIRRFLYKTTNFIRKWGIRRVIANTMRNVLGY